MSPSKMAEIRIDYDSKTTKHTGTNLDQGVSFTRCPLVSLSVPASKQLTMSRILKPFVKHLEALGDALEVVEKDQSLISTRQDGATPRVPPYTVSHNQMSSPAISIMLFLPEFGKSRAEKVRLKFKKSPWRLHHSIQLHRQSSSSVVVAKQEFYFLSRRYPLWSVCTGPQSSRVLRVNIFVRRFSAMVEFYRLVTGAEMESSKPGFCVFRINTQNYERSGDEGDPKGSSTQYPQTKPTNNNKNNSNEDDVTFELSLKRCPHVNPFSITDAHLTFPVPDIISLRTILHNYIRPLTSTHYLVHDPDGNPVILHDMSAIPTHRPEHTLQHNISAIPALPPEHTLQHNVSQNPHGNHSNSSHSTNLAASFNNPSSINAILATTINKHMSPINTIRTTSSNKNASSINTIPTTSSNKNTSSINTILTPAPNKHASSINTTLTPAPNKHASSINTILAPVPTTKHTSSLDKDSILSGSLDSGRFSDYETVSHCTTDLDQCMARLFPHEGGVVDTFMDKDSDEDIDECWNVGDVLFEPGGLDSDMASCLQMLNDCKRTFLFGGEEDEESVGKIRIGNLLTGKEEFDDDSDRNRSRDGKVSSKKKK